MPPSSTWQEVESRVHCPGRWVPITVGVVFLLMGAMGLVAFWAAPPRGILFWFPIAGAAAFAVVGCVVFILAVRSILFETCVCHAALDLLPHISTEPVTIEGSVVMGRLAHELVEELDGWEFRPDRRLWRNDKRFLLGFGVPYLAAFASLMSWVFHHEFEVGGWPISIFCGIAVTLVCGSPLLLIFGAFQRAGYRRLCRLRIPRNGEDLELDLPEESDLAKKDVVSAIQWMFFGGKKRKRIRIPPDGVAAVQLCPWKLATQRTKTWAVQGVLVLARPAEGAYLRLPLTLTSDFTGAAKLMERLAKTLGVPYLFHGDAEGWRVEEMRAKKRKPLEVGGMQV